jgi:hypothetical protein
MASPQNIFGGTATSTAGAASSAGAGVSDIFQGFGAESKATGDFAEAANYNLAATYASQEAAFTKQSTAIQEFQETRNLSRSLGQTTADVAGAGFAEAGSALDILRDSASQGALQKAVTSEQGLITEAGYKEEQQSYENMANSAVAAGNAEGRAATGDFIAGGVQAIAGMAALPI